MGLYAFARGFLYLNFDNDTHVIYEIWKWYSCVYMYGFCVSGIIWWVGYSFYIGGYLSCEDLGVLAS